MVAWRHNISLLMLKNISFVHRRVIFQHSKRNFISLHGHVISSILLRGQGGGLSHYQNISCTRKTGDKRFEKEISSKANPASVKLNMVHRSLNSQNLLLDFCREV